MDLSKLSDADLLALKAGDLSKVSDAGLMALKGQSAASAKIDPTEGMSFTEKALAGAGKALYDLGRGVGTLVTDVAPSAAKYGFATRKDIDEAKKLDAPLMNTGAGIAGNIAGNIAAFAPIAMIPGANTIAGGGLIGALTGALQPVGTNDSRVGNMELGGIAGAAVPTAIRAAKLLKAGLVDPFTEAGRTRIVGGALNRAAADPVQAAANMRAAAGNTPGFMPTAGQAADDAGIASFERAARAIDPAGFGSVDNSQRAALVNALRSVAKTPEERAAAVQAVEDSSKKLYGDAFKESVPVTPELQNIVTRDSMRAAEQRAIALAKEKGIPYQARIEDILPKDVPIGLRSVAPSMVDAVEVTPAKSIPLGRQPVSPSSVIEPPSTDSLGMLRPAREMQFAGDMRPATFELPEMLTPKTIQVQPDHLSPTYMTIPPVESVPVRDMHTLKMGMDAMLSDPKLGIAKLEADAIKGTRGELLDLLPESYQLARQNHIEMNRPVNQMDIGKELYNRFVPALADGADVPFKSRADALAQALRNGDALAKDVTGLKNATLGGIMEPDQMSLLNGVVKDAQMKAAAENAGRGVASDAVQKMAMSNLISEAGLPSWFSALAPLRPLGGMLKTAGDVLYTKNDDTMRHLLADVLKDPQAAASAMQQAGVTPSKIAEYLRLGVQAPTMALPAIINGAQQ